MAHIESGASAPAATERKASKAVCALTGRERPRRDLVPLDTLRPSLADRIRHDHPELAPDALISRAEVARYRALYVEDLLQAEHGEFTQLDRQVAESIAKHDTIAENVEAEFEDRRTLGERLSDHLASFGGSWTFDLFALFFGVTCRSIVLPLVRVTGSASRVGVGSDGTCDVSVV